MPGQVPLLLVVRPNVLSLVALPLAATVSPRRPPLALLLTSSLLTPLLLNSLLLAALSPALRRL